MNLAEWNIKSKELLVQLSSKSGIQASLQRDLANYGAVFTRDAVMAGIAGILISDQQITNSLVATLQHLKKFQGAHGQIASNYSVSTAGEYNVSYGTLSPKIDALTWYIIGVSICIREGLLDSDEWLVSITKAIECLEGFEYNNRNLIYVPQGGNWADEYILEGYTLYDQALRVWALRLAGKVYKNAKWKEKSEAILETILINYWPEEKNRATDAYHPRLYDKFKSVQQEYFYASFSPASYATSFDLAAHAILGILLPSGHKKMLKVFSWIQSSFMANEKLPGAFYPIIAENDKEWSSLSNFYMFSFKNKPGHYHNGGIWPIWIGWLAVSFSVQEQTTLLNNLSKLAEEQLTEFQFEEYLEADTKTPGGTKHMAYSATGLIFLSKAQTNRKISSIIGSYDW